MRLTRRDLLVSGFVATAGCIGVSNSTTPSSEDSSSPSSTTTRTQSPCQNRSRTDYSDDSTPTSRQTLDASRSVSIAEVIQQDGGDSLSAEATLREDTIMTEHPPTLQFTISADTATTVAYEDCPPGNLHHAQSTESDNHLYVTTYDADTETRACWHLPYTALNMGRPCFEKTVTVTPDTPFSRTFTIWDDRENTSCYPAERYRIDFPVAIEGSKNTRYRWSVFIRIIACSAQ